MKSTDWPTLLARQACPILVGLIPIVGLILAITLWTWPSWQEIQQVTASQEKPGLEEKLRLETELIKTSAQIALGILVLASLCLTWKRVSAAEQTVAVAQEGQITERFTRAVDQLGNRCSIAVRLGGIYALERIARDSEKDHWQVMELLAAFVREKSPHRVTESGEEPPCTQPIAKDIQAILTVLGRRNPKYDQKGLRLDLSNTCLNGARLTDANLEHMTLVGANLRKALFIRVNFRGAIFQNTILQGTNLRESKFAKCSFEGANLMGADLKGSKIGDSDFRKAINLTEEQIESTTGSMSAHLPGYLTDVQES